MSETEIRLWFTGLVCGAGAAGAVWHLAGDFLRRRRGWCVGDRQAARRASRRRLGAGLVIVISATFFFGVNHLEPQPDGTVFAAVWLLVGVQLLWLLALAVLDLRQTMQEVRRRRGELRERLNTWVSEKDED